MSKTTRREVIAGAAGVAAGTALGAVPATAANEPSPSGDAARSPDMTQYCYTLTINGGDHDALQAALVHYQQICEVMVANGHTRPFANYRLKMSNMLSHTSAAHAEALHEFCEEWKGRGAQRRTSEGWSEA
jgi:hypothetical protein